MITAAILFIIVGILMITWGVVAGRQPETDKTPKPHTVRTILLSIGIADIVIGMTIIALLSRG